MDSWRAQTEPCVHQDPGEGNSDPTRDWPRLARECPGVSGGCVGWRWPAAGLGALSVAVHAWDLLKKVAIIFITSTIVWPQVKKQGGTQPCPSTENWIKNLLSIALSIRTKPRFPLSQLSPIKKLPLASHPSPSEGRQNENHKHRKLTNLITCTTALSNSMKLWAMPCRATQDGWVIVESSDKTWSTGEVNGKPLPYSCFENPMNSMKRQKDRTLKNDLPRLVGAQYAVGDKWRNNSRKNEETEPKQKQHPVVDVMGDGNKVQCCKEQYCIHTWNDRPTNQGKLKEV